MPDGSSVPLPLKRAKQARAKTTENAFLDALDLILRTKDFKSTSVQDIAELAGLTKDAFMKRFGSKRNALYLLYERYCEKALATMDGIKRALPNYDNELELFCDMSKKLEQIILMDISSNRAMHEDFLENLQTHDLTKHIFLACVSLMEAAQAQFMAPGTYTRSGAFSAAQLLVTINFNQALRAMPGLPKDANAKHQLIAKIIETAIKT